MSRFACLIFLVLAFHFSISQSSIDVLHYRFEIELSDKTDSIKGKAVITLDFAEPSNKFSLNLAAPNSNGKGMIVYLVKENNEVLASMQNQDSLILSLKRTAKKGEARTFEIFYKGIPSDGLIIAKNRYGDRTFFADNWPNRAHNWIPCKDDPGDKATFEFIVIAPSQYSVISNGKLQEEKMLPANMKLTHWVEDVSLSTKVMVIGVAKFAVKQFADSPPNIPVSAWTYPQDSVVGFRNYSVAPSIVKYFSDYIGPYPYNKLANVQSKTIFGGMENASAIFYYEKSAEEGKSPEIIIAHEIAHQWFGDMVSEKKFSHLWLSEGFATYFENMYIGSKFGKDSMKNKLIRDRQDVIDFASNRPVVDSVSQLMSLLNANSYQKGGWVLYMLRNEMGDSVFQKFIRTFYDRFKGKNADTNDLEIIAEEVSNKDWNQFFKQWLYTPGIPRLDIQWKYDEKAKAVSITITQVQSQFVFQFPLQIKLESEQSSEIKTLNITKQSETYSIPLSTATRAIVADPNTLLLFDSRVENLNP